ncbi:MULTISPECIES: hypothetical protein [unclassified Ruegeria]|uniref:hypothetical protein n=1 Tax=unclassified Ruegeria TaxID=2625375 RepID=UPI001487893B|nr:MULTISPECIES: hypothetical protein [unclassified Ruegeria]
MSRWLDIVRKAREYPDHHTGTQQEPLKRGGKKRDQGFLLVSNGCRVESEEKDRAPHPPQQPPNQGPVPNKAGVGGRPVTWTGKVVNLDEWRNMTDWERYGPRGKHWNGKTQKWEKANEQ